MPCAPGDPQRKGLRGPPRQRPGSAEGEAAVLAKVIDMTMVLRVKEEEEYVGLDISQHGERAFT